MSTQHHDSLLQSELLLPEQSTPDMHFASRLISQMQRELSQRKRYMLRIASKWLVAYDYVKMLEEEHLLAVDPLQVQTQFFRGTLSVVHGLGLLLIGHLQSEDADRLDSLGLSFADLSACVEELGDIKRAIDSDMTPEMAHQMNQQLFGGANG